MSDILEFIVKNFQHLRPTDYALLLAFVALAGAAIFTGLRWIYAARFQAQKDLIELQGQTVTALSSHLDLTKRERDDLRQELDGKMRRLQELERMGPAVAAERDAAREDALQLIARGLIAMLDRAYIVYQLLFEYARIVPVPPPPDAVNAAEEFVARVSSLREKYEETARSKDREALPALVALFQSEELSQSARYVYKRFTALADETKTHRSKGRKGG